MPRTRRPEKPLEFFVDRCLGRAFPLRLREAGYVVHTMLSVYGAGAEERVRDEDWLRLAGTRGWVVLTKDGAIRRRPAEIRAVEVHRVRAFVLTERRLTGEQQQERFLRNIHRIRQQSRKPGPYIFAVRETRIELIWPKSAQ